MRTVVCNIGAERHRELHEIAHTSLFQFATVHVSITAMRSCSWSKRFLERVVDVGHVEQHFVRALPSDDARAIGVGEMDLLERAC